MHWSLLYPNTYRSTYSSYGSQHLIGFLILNQI